MVDTDLRIKVNADTASIGGIKAVEKAIQNVKAETEKAQRLAGILAQEYGLSQQEAAQVAAELKRVQSETRKAVREGQGLQGLFEGIAQGIGQELTQAGIGALRDGLGAIAGVAQSAIQEFESFEAALTEFDAKSDASAEQIERIGNQAKELAAVTSQTPAGVAALSTALLTLGATADDVEENLSGITKLSDVLGEDPVLTGRVVQTGINNFGELGESADTLTDKLSTLVNTTAAGSAQGIEEFFQFFQDVGPLASTLEADFDQLAAGFATLRDSGFSASTSATGLRIALLRLSAPSGEAQTLLEGLASEIDGVDNLAFNADGSFRGFEETLRNFQQATADLNNQEQLELAKRIFGDEGAPAILALLDQVDGKYQQTLSNLESSAGAVDESLEILNQSLERQAELLQGNISGALTSLGQALAPIKLTVVEFANEVLSATLESSEGFEALTAAGERLNAVLTENPEIAAQIGEAFATLADAAVDQLVQVIDALTALAANEDAVNETTKNIQELAGAIVAIGQSVRFIIALADGFASLKQQVSELPIIGDNLEAAFSSPIPVLTLLLKLIEDIFNGARVVVEEFFSFTTTRLAEFGDALAQVGNILSNLPGLGQLAASAQQLGADLQQLGTTEITPAFNNDDFASQVNEGLAQAEQAINSQNLTVDMAADTEKLMAATEEAAEAQVQAQTEIAKTQEEIDEAQAEAQAARIRQAERETAILKEQRAEAEAIARESFEDDSQQRQNTFDDQRLRREEALENRLNAIREQGQQQIEAFRKTSQEALQSDQEAFERRQQSEAEAFQRRQQAEAKAFQQALDNERDRESGILDAAAEAAERSTQLRLAATQEEREALEAQFRAQDERREILAEEQERALRTTDENDVPEQLPIEQARQELEERLQGEQEAFQAQQQAETDAFRQQQEAEREAFEDELLIKRETAEQIIAALQQQNAEVIEALKKAAAEEERQLERTFQENERQLERDFKAEQRRLDRENAEEVRQILDQARQTPSVEARRHGGPVEAGKPYIVGEAGPELIFPSRDGYVATARETAAMMTAPSITGSINTPQANTTSMRGVEQRLDQLIEMVSARPPLQAPANYTLISQQPQQDAIALELGRIQAMVKRRGL